MTTRSLLRALFDTPRLRDRQENLPAPTSLAGRLPSAPQQPQPQQLAHPDKVGNAAPRPSLRRRKNHQPEPHQQTQQQAQPEAYFYEYHVTMQPVRLRTWHRHTYGGRKAFGSTVRRLLIMAALLWLVLPVFTASTHGKPRFEAIKAQVPQMLESIRQAFMQP